METSDFDNRAANTLTRLGLGHWKVYRKPGSDPFIRGKVLPEKLRIEIYDLDDSDAWDTLIHEVIEIKMRSALRPYRIVFNAFISAFQEILEGEKDDFIESLGEVFKVTQDSPPSP